MRIEHDFLGEKEVPDDVLYGVQTLRAMDNFQITGQHLDHEFIAAIATVKKAAAMSNQETGRLEPKIAGAIAAAADEVIAGQWLDQFPVDPIQGGAGTSINMNMNEVLANRALDLLGKPRGSYAIVSPNNHINMAQSTNDSFPTSIKVCLCHKNHKLIGALEELAEGLDAKSEEFADVVKLGRTHLQDAVPITLGQEMAAYASAVRRAIRRIEQVTAGIHAINMGATAVGTGLNAEPEYIRLVARNLSKITGEPFHTASNLIDATNNTDGFADVSAALRVTALVLIKMANDIRLMASGPRCGLNEVKLPARQPGSSIMPGKVNPVIPEAVNQTAFQVIANDMAVTLAAEAGQLQLNAMEPLIIYNLLNSMRMLGEACRMLEHRCIRGIKANRERCAELLDISIGSITALVPHIGYANASRIAQTALHTGGTVRELILAEGLLSEERLEHLLSPQNMLAPGA